MIENITDIVNELMQSARFPLLIALLLGLLVSLNPCQLAINISALTYIQKNSANTKECISKGIIYAIGRTICYVALGWTLTILIRQGNNIEIVRQTLSKAEEVLPFILIGIGLLLIVRAIMSHRHKHGDSCHNSGQVIRKNGPAGPLMLGITLALAFCPESAVFFFGMLVPLSATSPNGWTAPLAFALSASVPVIILSYLIATAMQTAHKFEHLFTHFQQWLNIATGLTFIVIACLLLI